MPDTQPIPVRIPPRTRTPRPDGRAAASPRSPASGHVVRETSRRPAPARAHLASSLATAPDASHQSLGAPALAGGRSVERPVGPRPEGARPVGARPDERWEDDHDVTRLLEERAPRPRLTQVVASALAAVSTTVLLSYLGVAGTIVGAAVASVITVFGNFVYHRSILRAGQRVATVLRPCPTTGEPVEVEVAAGDAAGRGAGRTQTADGRGASRTQTADGSAAGRRTVRRRLVLAVVAVFVAIVAAVTVVEVVAGRPLSHLLHGTEGGGTSISDIGRRGSSGSEGPAPAETPTPAPSPSETGSSPEPTPAPAQTPPGSDQGTGGAVDPGTGTGTGTGTGGAGSGGSGTDPAPDPAPTTPPTSPGDDGVGDGAPDAGSGSEDPAPAPAGPAGSAGEAGSAGSSVVPGSSAVDD